MQPHNSLFSYHLLSRYPTFFFLCVMTLIGLTAGCGNSEPTQVDASDFESFEISTLPTPSGIINLNKRDAEPVVALNALVFKEEATGEKYDITQIGHICGVLTLNVQIEIVIKFHDEMRQFTKAEFYATDVPHLFLKFCNVVNEIDYFL